MRIKIEKNDLNNATKILYNVKGNIEGCNLKELDETNTELYINKKKYNYNSYFIPEEEGIYEIKLKIKILMKSCCCLFYSLDNLISVDLSSFNSQDVTNMSYMFYGCTSLNSITLNLDVIPSP